MGLRRAVVSSKLQPGQNLIVPVNTGFEASGFNFDTEQRIKVSGGDSGWIGFSYSNGL